jgi:hypothetical protein
MEVDVVTLSSEFPNDNPALHRGVSWVCLEPTGPAIACCEAPEPMPEPMIEACPERVEAEAPPAIVIAEPDANEHEDEGEGEEIVVEELELVDVRVEGVTPAFEEMPACEPPPRESTAPPPAPDDPFAVLVCTLAEVAIGAGALDVAALLPGLLFDGRLPEALEGDVAVALREGGLWDGAAVTPSFIAGANAWRSILRGTSDDFAACEPSMLDEWAAELLARLLQAPAKAPTFRQELRSRGVAAFGLVEAAA